MNSVTIGMPYIGQVLSVNHYLGKRRDGGYYVKKEVKDWQEMLGWLVKSSHVEEWKLPLIVRCDGVFRDKRSQPDLSNCSKVILDSLEEVSGVNDRDMRWQDGDVSYGDEPRLIIAITEAKE